jgi:pyruvate dehydrogenase E1 component beta subunit
MSGGKVNVPIVIRLIIGKGWGQGPQHSQSLETIFAHMPGLKVVCPSNANDAKGMLISSIKDPDPVIFFEHRWLHSIKDQVPKKFYSTKINNAKIIRRGKDITVISFSYALIETLRAVNFLKKINISCELIDLRCLRPIDKKTILKSAKKTKKVLIVDNGWTINGISAEISAIINENIDEKIIVRRIGILNVPIPSTPSLAKYCYPDEVSIVKVIGKILNKKILKKNMPKRRKNLDQPDKNFKGPF